MNIAGPFLNPQRKHTKGRWYLSYFAPLTLPNGAPKLDERGRPILKRFRPSYATKEDAQADKPRLMAQHAAGGSGAGGVLTRAQVEDYEAARREAPEASQLELAKFWRLHHPRNATKKLRELAPAFLEWVKARLGETRHYEDLKSRLKTFLGVFGDRLPATVTREEFLTWLLATGKAGRTVLNQKRVVVNFFNWLATEAHALETNPLSGIKKRQLPKALPKEIQFLSLVQANRYLRALERYDPDLVAHEIVQLFSGVRADDEMADFDGQWVIAGTREIVVPAHVAKTGRREVLDNLEPTFWEWWKHYGRGGLLRPKNYLYRWARVRVLAAVEDRAQADQLARRPIKTLLARPESKAALKDWPWNARRRTFCTYHVAKYQSAAKTALILRHRGRPETLHNSYRGTGVSQEEGVAFFAIAPNAVPRPILPARPARGVIRLQLERRRLAPPAAAAGA